MKSTQKWNKMFLTGMAALAAALAFGLLFIGCGDSDPEPAPGVDLNNPIHLTLTTRTVKKLDSTVFELPVEKWSTGSENSIRFYLEEAVAVGDTYEIHLAGQSDKDIPHFFVAINQVEPWDNLDYYTDPHKTVIKNTYFDITFYVRAEKPCDDLSKKPYIVLAATGEDGKAVDLNNPVRLTLTVMPTVRKLEGNVLTLNPYTWDGGSNNLRKIDFRDAIVGGSRYQLHLAGKSDKTITRLTAR